MATSDSEDFESADEDLDAKTECSSSKPGAQHKHMTDECGDNMRNRIQDELMRNELGGGDLHNSSDDKVDEKRREDMKTDILTKQECAQGSEGVVKVTSNETVVEEKIKSKVANERTRRQQKPREPKSSGSVRKLGTKISPSNSIPIKEKELQVKLEALELENCENSYLPVIDKKERNEPEVNLHVESANLEEEVEKLCLDEKENNNVAPVLDRLSDSSADKQAEGSSGWGGWGGWGVTSLLSTASESVSTLTSQVSQGFTTVLETGIGAPDPEELARLDREEEMKLLEEKEQNKANELSELQREEEQKSEAESSGLFGFSNLISGVSSITKLVETTGSKVLTGGLDTLETIGKKTMEVLQEGDPGLKKKRALFSEKIVLSQVLREAKDKAEREAQEIEDKEAARKAHFETLFDDYQGLVHLEALEMLSKQCDIKLQSILLTSTGPQLSKLQDSVKIVKDLCQLPDDEDIEDEVKDEDWIERIETATKDLGAPFATDKLSKTWDEAQNWLEEYHSRSSQDTDQSVSIREIHQKAIASLAQLTASAVEQFHKVAELLLVKDGRTPTQEAEILLQVTTILTSQLSTVATRFSECLNTASEGSANSDVVNNLITNVFLEAANSSSYIQEAFQLLIPVLQVGITL